MAEKSCIIEKAVKIYSDILDNAKKGSVFGGFDEIFKLLKEQDCELNEPTNTVNFEFLSIFVRSSDGSIVPYKGESFGPLDKLSHPTENSIDFFNNSTDPNIRDSASMAYSVLSAIFECYNGQLIKEPPSVVVVRDRKEIHVNFTFNERYLRGGIERSYNNILSAQKAVHSVYSNVFYSL